ncbi:MAG: hypothetical protein K1X65_23990 [Caldilineales bacterium]|nr:hypothetical protein [Caldilineales bacterium]
MSTYLHLMGWNEILARVFDGFQVQRDVSPDWLVNPGTRRRLKLDLVYPDIGVAVRFVGLQVKGAGRKSEWEELEDASRDEVRKELCRMHGIDLFLLSPDEPFPAEQFKALGILLGNVSRRIAQGGRFQGKAATMEALSQARGRLDELRRRVNRPDDLVSFAESWRDREARLLMEAQKPQPKPNGATKAVAAAKNLQVGQRVQHEKFGPGTVSRLEPKDGDVYLTIAFVNSGERILLASLIGDKLTVASR